MKSCGYWSIRSREGMSWVDRDDDVWFMTFESDLGEL